MYLGRPIVPFVTVLLLLAGVTSVYSFWSTVDSHTKSTIEKEYHRKIINDDTRFAGGNGSKGDPYQITNVSELQNIALDLEANYTITNDVDASETKNWNSDYGFNPIGSEGVPFNGNLDGGGFNITGLFINRSNWVGLFGYLGMGGRVSNLSLVEINITGNNGVGGIGGGNKGTVDNCSVTGIVSGLYLIGGLVGVNDGGIMKNCCSANHVNGSWRIGGLVGFNINEGAISNSYTTGNTSGYDWIGGLIGGNGYAYQTRIPGGPILHCYTMGNVSGYQYVGGLVGSIHDSKIEDCYAICNVSGERKVGGLVGEMQTTNQIKNCFSFGEVNGIDYYIGGLIGFNSGEIDDIENSFNCINYTTINGKTSVSRYGIYRDQFEDWKNNEKTINIDDYMDKAPGTEKYKISKVNDMKTMLAFVYEDYNFIQTGNINLSNESDFYIPIFAAEEFDGNGHSISNLNVSFSSRNEIGLFGHIWTTSRIKNIHLENVQVSGKDSIGGLVGCSSRESRISSCYVNGHVTGEDNIGGLVGEAWGYVSTSCSTSNVMGSNRVGGLVGYAYQSISNCYAAGNVNGKQNVGGLIGKRHDFETIFECFWDNQSSGCQSSDGGNGKKTSEMMKKNTFSDVGWDFSDTWSIIDGASYPFLRNLDYDIRINTSNEITTYEDKMYYVDYNAITSLPGNPKFGFWSLVTDANSWLTMDEYGLLMGTPSNDEVGPWSINVTASVDDNSYCSTMFILEVINTNDVPTITTIPGETVHEDNLYVTDFEATDVDPITNKLNWSLETNALFLKINISTGILSGIPLNCDVGSWWVNVSVNDGQNGSDFENFTLTVINTNDAPEINSTPPVVVFNEDETYYGLRLNDWFRDVDGDPLVYFSRFCENISVEIFANSTVVLTPKEDWCGTDKITFYANDSKKRISDVIVITVKPVNDVPTELSIIQENRDYYEGQAQPAYGNATDADLPYGDLLNFTWSFNTSDRVLWGPEVDLSLPAGKHKVILLVSDSENQTARISINITILGINVDDDDADDDDTDDDVSDDDSDDDVDDDIGDDDADDDVGGEEDKDSKDSMMVYIVMGGILLLIITTIIIVLIFFILGGRKRKMDENGVDNDKPTEALIGIEPSLPPVEKELSYDLDYSEIHTQENLYDEMENVGDQQTYHKESPLPQKSSAFEDKFQFQHESLAGVDGEMECLPEACSMESAEPVEDHMPQVSSDDISLEEYTIEGNWSKDVAVVSSENLSGVDDTGSNHEDILEELLRVY